MAEAEGEATLGLRVCVEVPEVDNEADRVRVFDVDSDELYDNEAEAVNERVPVHVVDTEADSDGVAEMLAVAVPESLEVPVCVAVNECVDEGETEPVRDTVADSDNDGLLLVDTLRLGVALSVRQLRPP